MTTDEFTVRFWGVRGSYPVAAGAAIRFGGNTPCVEIQAGGHTIILDAGTGIIGLGQHLAQRARERGESIRITLVFTHFHHDHTQGLPFFAPAYMPTTRLQIFAPDLYEEPAMEILANVMAAPTFPVSFQGLRAQKTSQSVTENDIIHIDSASGEASVISSGVELLDPGSVRIQAMRSYGHPQGVMIYRIRWRDRSVVYATDTEGYRGGDQRLVDFAHQTDLLIHDAQYTDDHYLGRLAGAPVTQGFGHSTGTMACETARSAQVGSLVLFHHDPNYDDEMIAAIERRARKVFPNTMAAQEGQVIDLLSSQHAPGGARCEDAPVSTGVARSPGGLA